MSPTTNPSIAIAYIRASTGSQTLTLEGQEDACRAWCAANDVELISVHVDAGVSGKASLANRPGLMAAMSAVVSNRAGVLLVAKMDRLSRDPLVSLTIEKAMAASGARVVSTEGEGSGSDEPTHIFMKRILGAMSELESSLISARTKSALAVKKQRGERVGRPPKGFSLGDEGTLVRNEEYVDVYRILEMREAGATYKVITEMTGANAPTISIAVKRWGTTDSLEAFEG